MRLPAVISGLMVAALFVAAPVSAQADPEPIVFYPTSGTTSFGGVSGNILSTDEPSGGVDSDTLSAVPVLGPSSISWFTEEPWTDDLEVFEPISVTFTLSAAVEVLGAITVDVVSVSEEGVIEVLGSDTASTLLSLTPRSQSFSIGVSEPLRENTVTGLVLTVSGVDVLVTVDSNDAAAADAGFPVRILDSDGDGYGDSLERRLGTDPDDPDSRPGGVSPNAGGDNDDDSPEGIVASIFMLATLAVGGIALLGRFSP